MSDETLPGRHQQVLELTGESTPIREIVRDLFKRWDLVPMMARKDFQSRYRSATLGVLWSVMLPVIQGSVMAIVFSVIIKVPAEGDNRAVYILSGIVAWTYFTQAWGAGSTSIVDQAQIAGKVYFPRLFIPSVPALANFPSMAISTGVAFIIALAFRSPISWTIVMILPAMALTVVLAIELSAITTLLHVYYRDIRYIVQAVMSVAMYGAPIIYPLDQAKRWQWVLVYGNPMTGPVQLMHEAFLGHATKVVSATLATCGYVVVLGAITLLAFRRHERTAVDRL
jgi:ABC-type polysaccharide/polyol phosphate export permease